MDLLPRGIVKDARSHLKLGERCFWETTAESSRHVLGASGTQ